MACRSGEKLHSRSGMSWLLAILLVAIIVMSVVVCIPWVRGIRQQADDVGCDTAVENARRELTVAYLSEGAKPTEDWARRTLAKTYRELDGLCPVGGEIYVVDNPNDDELPIAIVCGLHGRDAKQNTRLNAKRALQRLREELLQSRKDGQPLPEALTVSLNGTFLTARLVTEPVNLKRGTATTSGYDGTVAFYGIAGNGGVGEDAAVREGEICYFAFADEQHCAIYEAGSQWTGDSYR